MAFTDRFVTLPIKIYSEAEKELTGKAQYDDAFINVLPLDIVAYKGLPDEENGIPECVNVSLKNGDRFNVYMTLIEFETCLNNHMK